MNYFDKLLYEKKSNYFLLGLIGFLVLSFVFLPFEKLLIQDFQNDDFRLIGYLKNMTDFSSVLDGLFVPQHHKFRPTAILLYYLEYQLFGDNYNLYVAFNIFLVVISGLILIYLIEEYTSLPIRFLVFLALITSRFFYYNIWNITGSFETLALIFYGIMLIGIFKKKNLLFIVLIPFIMTTSERYLPAVLALSFFLALSKRWYFALASFTLTLSVFFLPRAIFDIPNFVGTQTDNILESFDISRFVEHALRVVLEGFGVSTGPTYLTGLAYPVWLHWSDWSTHDKYTLVVQVLYAFATLWMFLRGALLKSKTIAFAILLQCIFFAAAASVTFRVELRWITPLYFMILIMSFYGLKVSSSIARVDGAIWYPMLFKEKVLCCLLSFMIFVNLLFFYYSAKNFYFAGAIYNKLLID